MKISTEIGSAAAVTGEERAIELVAEAGFDAWDFSMMSMCRYDWNRKVLVENDMAKLRTIDEHTAGKFRSFEIDITYPAAWGDSGVEAHLASL